MQHDRAVVLQQPRARIVVGGSCVDHDGLARVARECELRVEEFLLSLPRRVVAVVVKPGLADGDGLRVREQLAELVEVARLSRLVRMHAETRVDAVLLLGARKRCAGRCDRGRNVDHARHADRPRSREHLGRVVAQVRVRVDHAVVASSRGNSGGAAATVVVAASRP